MTILRAASAATLVSIFFALFATVLPGDVTAATDAPRCVLNTVVQSFNDGGTTISWKVYNAHTIELSGIGSVSDADSIVVYPSEEKTYTLTATGKYGADTCTVNVLPTSAYNFDSNYYDHNNTYKCEMWVEPDFVVPGGTAVLSWDAGSADHVVIDHGVGNMSKNGSITVPNTGTPQTFSMVAYWNSGTTRTCNATVHPAGGVVIAPTFNDGIGTPGVINAPTTYTGTPNINSSYTQPQVQYVPVSRVPYTGTDDTLYVLTLLAVALGAFGILYAQRGRIAGVLASFSPTDNDDTAEVQPTDTMHY